MSSGYDLVGSPYLDTNNPRTGVDGQGRWNPGGDGGSNPGTDGGPGIVVLDPRTAQAIEASEMVLKIVSPSALPNTTVTNTTTVLSGIVTGVPDCIVWESSMGNSGMAAGIPFWKTSAVFLNNGDNQVTVRAGRECDDTITCTGCVEIQSDEITLTVNPAFKFGSRLIARPNVLFVGQTVDVFFNISANLYKNFVPGTLRLLEVDAMGNPAGTDVALADDGNTSVTGDEISGDAIYTAKAAMAALPTPGAKYFRARATLQGGTQLAYSEIITLDVIQPVTTGECMEILQLQNEALQAYNAALNSGGQSAAVEAARAHVAASDKVVESGVEKGGHGVWVRYVTGLLGALPLSPDGYRGGSPQGSGGGDDFGSMEGALLNHVPIGSRRALLMSPFASEPGFNDENISIANTFAEVSCPAFEVNGCDAGDRAKGLCEFQTLGDTQANLREFQDMWRYGVVSIASHGDSYFGELSAEAKSEFGWFHKGSQELVWTGEPVQCEAFSQSVGATCSKDSECGAGARCVIQKVTSGFSGLQESGVCVDYLQADLRRGRLAIGSERYGILPTFITFHAQDPYPNSVVYLGSCRSAWNGSMAAAFFGMGARTIVGYSDYVSNEFANARGSEFFDRLIRPDATTGKSLLSGQAHLEIPDPDNTTSFFRLIGARNLDASNAEIINPSFESGDAAGWKKDGDGRVIAQLGESLPVSGKFLGIISTGLGFTTQTGELSQTFCIPEGRTKLTFWWRFYSEEFMSWCGSQFQDTFEASLESANGALQATDVNVDDICPLSECVGCGGLYPLELSDVHFDQGEAYRMKEWTKTEVSLLGTPFPGGGPVTLRLFATDKGDSIFDSVILVDDVKIE